MKAPMALGVLLTALVGPALAEPALAEPVAVRAAPHDGFFRVVFDWPNPVTYEARMDGQVLVVAFDRAIESDFAQVRGNLAEVVRSVDVADDGQTVRFELAAAHTVRDFVLDGSVVIDAAPAAVETPAASPAENVRVRVGEHAEFSRLVFDWPASVDYEITRTGDGVRLRFARPAALDLAAVSSDLPRGLISAVVVADGQGGSQGGSQGAVLDLVLEAGVGVREFRDGPRVVVDLLLAAADSDAGDETPGDETPGEETPGDVAADDVAEEAVVTAPVTLVPVTLAPAPRSPADAVEQAADDGTTAGDGAEEAAVSAPVALVPDAVAAVAEVTEVTKQEVTPGNGVTAAASTGGTAGNNAGSAVIPAQFTADADGGVLSFTVARPAAAVFRRGGTLWVVLRQAGQVDVAALATAAKDVVVDIQQLAVDTATVLRMETIAGFNPVVSQTSDGLALAMRRQRLAPTDPVEILAGTADDSAGGAAVRVALANAGDPVALVDPDIGDTLIVVPAATAGMGVDGSREFVEFRLGATAQGVVVVPLSDGVDVSRVDGGIVVGGRGLAVSSEADRTAIRQAAAGQDVLPRLFEFAAWRHDDADDYPAARHALLAQTARVDGQDRNRARFEFARFLFAQARPGEAVGVLAAINRDGDKLSRDPDFRALRGASLFLLGRADLAAPDLTDSALDGEPEIGLWRAALAAERGQWEAAAAGLREGELYAQRYPDRLRVRFSFLGADAMLRVDDPVGALGWLESLAGVELRDGEAAQRDLLQGRLSAIEGDTELALAAYEKAATSRDRRVRALATLARVELGLEAEVIDLDEAIEQLDRLRFVWRGDDLELEILSTLGDLYIENGAFRNGLQTLKRAATNFTDHPRVPQLTEAMQAVFEDLFIGGAADELSALQAIALFNQFRELTPAGEEGDEMIRKLAERLVSVDLLEQAAALLTHQVEFRVDGDAKAKVGASLAVIRLLDRRPEAALEALEFSAVDGVPPAIEVERTLLEARAKAELGLVDDALEVIEADASFDADQLRAEILWRARDWKRAAPVFRRLIGPAPRSEETLDQQRTRFVLNLAVSLSLSGDRRALERLRRDFGVAMQRSDFAYDFRVIAADDSDPADFESALARVASVDDFQAFLDSYRARLSDGSGQQG